MAKIIISLDHTIRDGEAIKFKAPCACTAVDGLTVNYPVETSDVISSASQSFVFTDAHGNDLTGIGNLFEEGAYIQVLLNTENGVAYIQNADTNGYLEHSMAHKSQIVQTELGTSWSNATPPTQTFQLEGVKANTVVEVSVAATATAAEVEAYQKLNLQDGGQIEGSITLRAFGILNTVSIPITIIVRGDT